MQLSLLLNDYITDRTCARSVGYMVSVLLTNILKTASTAPRVVIMSVSSHWLKSKVGGPSYESFHLGMRSRCALHKAGHDTHLGQIL